MRNIYIDAGGFSGDTVELFLEKYPDAKKFDIFCFEPNPEMHHYHKNKGYKFFPFAVWIKECELMFYLAKNKIGSTLMKSKKNQKIVNSVQVKAIDISCWIKSNFSESDNIVMKMDIEGAEYDVLDHMVENGSISYIKELFVDWHSKKMKNFNHDKYKHMLKTLKNLGLAHGNMCGETWRIER